MVNVSGRLFASLRLPQEKSARALDKFYSLVRPQIFAHFSFLFTSAKVRRKMETCKHFHKLFSEFLKNANVTM